MNKKLGSDSSRSKYHSKDREHNSINDISAIIVNHKGVQVDPVDLEVSFLKTINYSQTNGAKVKVLLSLQLGRS